LRGKEKGRNRDNGRESERERGRDKDRDKGKDKEIGKGRGRGSYKGNSGNARDKDNYPKYRYILFNIDLPNKHGYSNQQHRADHTVPDRALH
jgi:hypothetical protein